MTDDQLEQLQERLPGQPVQAEQIPETPAPGNGFPMMGSLGSGFLGNGFPMIGCPRNGLPDSWRGGSRDGGRNR